MEHALQTRKLGRGDIYEAEYFLMAPNTAFICTPSTHNAESIPIPSHISSEANYIVSLIEALGTELPWLQQKLSDRSNLFVEPIGPRVDSLPPNPSFLNNPFHNFPFIR